MDDTRLDRTVTIHGPGWARELCYGGRVVLTSKHDVDDLSLALIGNASVHESWRKA